MPYANWSGNLYLESKFHSFLSLPSGFGLPYMFLHIHNLYPGVILSMESYHIDHAWMLSHVSFFATLGTIAFQAPLSMGFPRQEYWNGLPFLSPGDLPNPGIKFLSLALADWLFTTELPGRPHHIDPQSKWIIGPAYPLECLD